MRGSGRAAVVVVIGLVVRVAPAAANHAELPSAVRLTGDASHAHPPTRSWGSFFAFSSTAHLAGKNTHARQIYLFRLRDYACQFGRPDLGAAGEVLEPCPAPPRSVVVQVTAGGGAPDNPSVNGAGTLVAFDADGSFGGLGGDAATHRQIYLKDLRTGAVTPVTARADGDSERPSLDEAGDVLVFESTADLTRGGAGIAQIFAYDVATQRTAEITNGDGPSTGATISRAGDQLAFEAMADLAGDGHATAWPSIFWCDRTKSPPLLRELTPDANGPSRHPAISEAARGLVFFDSAASDLPGVGAHQGTQIYSANGQDVGGDVTRYTSGPGDAFAPALDPSGTQLVFIATGDLLGNGTTGNRLFAMDLASRMPIQLTGRGDVQGPLGASAGSWLVTAATTDDAAGTGICGRQLYALDYYPAHYDEGLRSRVAASAPGVKPVEPAPGDPNASCDDLDPCTDDACGPVGSCVHTIRPEKTVCGTGDACTGTPICLAGQCTPRGGIDCDDGDPCTTDTCDPLAVAHCRHVPLAGAPGLSCYGGPPLPVPLAPALQRRFGRVQALLKRAVREAPRASYRHLAAAKRTLRGFLRALAATRNLPADTKHAVADRINKLIGRIDAVRHDLTPLLPPRGRGR